MDKKDTIQGLVLIGACTLLAAAFLAGSNRPEWAWFFIGGFALLGVATLVSLKS